MSLWLGVRSADPADAVDGALWFNSTTNALKAFVKGVATDIGALIVGQAEPKGHAGEHVTGGADVIADAVPAGNAGLMTGADKLKLDGL